MKRIQFVLLLLIALFVWTSQSTIIHFQYHDIEENSECIVCDTSEKIKLYQHNGHIVVINENLVLNIGNEVKQVLVDTEFDYTDIPLFICMDIVKFSQYPGRFIVPGINATAPPVFFS